MQSSHPNTAATATATPDEETVQFTRPSLPPLYFQQQQQPASATFPLCPELETHILSYLSWGDHTRLAPVHKRLSNIVHDAAQQSNDAKWALAQSLLNGENGLAENPTLARRYLLELSNAHVNLDEFSPEYEETIAEEVKAEEGENEALKSKPTCEYSTAAMRQLASCYLEGNGVDANSTAGLAWLQQAYKHGDIDAAYETATIFEHGTHGIVENIYIAAKWFLGAAKAGHVESMAEYAMCLELGCGVNQCDTKALDWYTKAAEKGHVTSNFSVGEMFESARGGVPQSDTEAVLWYYKAAMLGDEDSKMALKRLNDIARIVVPGWAAALNV